MSENIIIESVGTLHKIRDPKGASYRFVSEEDKLISATVFREGDVVDDEVSRYKNVKMTVIIEVDDDDHEYSINTQ